MKYKYCTNKLIIRFFSSIFLAADRQRRLEFSKIIWYAAANDLGGRRPASASNFKILSYNCNSIGKNPKRGQVFHFLKKKKADILILVDTRLSKEVENQVKAEWGGFAFFSSYSSQSRGIAVLFSCDFPGKVLDTFADLAGNISAILLERVRLELELLSLIQ